MTWIDAQKQTPKEGQKVLVFDVIGELSVREVSFEGLERFFWKPIGRGVYALCWAEIPPVPERYL